MAVLNANASNPASLLDQIVSSVDPKSPANISYVKARMAIEAAGLTRKPLRELKMVVVSYLKGEICHPNAAEKARGATNQVVFPDRSKARF